MIIIGTTEDYRHIYRADNLDGVRKYRNQLLAETDWAAGSDVTMSDAMRTYRQALRDLPQQPNFPNSFIFPVKPE